MASEMEHNNFVDLKALFLIKFNIPDIGREFSLIKQQALNTRLAYLLDTRTIDLWTNKNQEY